MSSTLIEVSSANADIKTETTLTTVLSPPLVMTTPSVLQFAEGFIDQREIGNSGNDSFILTSPVDVSIDMAYYELYNGQVLNSDGDELRKNAFNNTTIGTKTDDNDRFIRIGKVFALYQVVYKTGTSFKFPTLNFNGEGVSDILEINLITETFNFTLDEGTYTTQTIVQTLNDKMQGTFYGDKFYNGENLYLGFEDNAFYRPFSHFVNKYVEFDTTTKNFKKALVFIPVTTDPISINFDVDVGQYFYPQEPTDNTEVYIGCPIVAIENTDDIIQWAYLHNPVYKLDIQSNARDEYIQLNANPLPDESGENYYWVYARGGVALVSLNPDTFWADLLGFKNNDFLLERTRQQIVGEILNVPIAATMDFISITGNNSLSTATTRPFIGVSDIDEYVVADLGVDKDFINNTSFPITLTLPIRTLSVNNTVTINATQPIQFAQFNSGGHFRIEVDIGYYINNFSSAKTKKSIACIASREYLTNGFLSVFSGGQPIALPAGSVLSYISVSILDPITGKAPPDIGSANTFYFSLG
jgi:hypothetical protein